MDTFLHLLKHAKDFAQVVALLGAGLFFFYKAITGYLRVNLLLSINCQREKLDRDHDYLVICVSLTKGANGSLTLHDATARVAHGETVEVISFPGIVRSGYKEELNDNRRKIDWSCVDNVSPFLKLVPEDETQLAAVLSVPAGTTCTIEVAIYGQKTNGKPFGQWKASCVSLPLRV